MSELVESVKGINKNRVIDNLDDLDRKFCKTWDKLCETFDELLALYKRIMVRAYEIKGDIHNSKS